MTNDAAAILIVTVADAGNMFMWEGPSFDWKAWAESDVKQKAGRVLGVRRWDFHSVMPGKMELLGSVAVKSPCAMEAAGLIS